MNSQIRIISPQTKIIITIGLGLTIALIVSMFLFPLFWQVVLFALSGSLVIYILGTGLVWIATVKHKLAMLNLERSQTRFMTVSHEHSLFDTQSSRVMVAATSLRGSNIIEAEYKEVVQPKRDALSLIDDGFHFLMIGDTGSGKSTLAAHYIQTMGIRNTVVCDPHASRNDWPAGVKIAQGYEIIATVLYGAVKEMNRRYATNSDNDSLILLAIDELPAIVDTLTELGYDVGTWIRRLSREGRKVNIRLLIMSQGENVGDLGQKGYSSVKLNFIKVIMSRQDTLHNVAKVVYSNGKAELITLHGPLQFSKECKVLALPAPLHTLQRCKVCGKEANSMYCSNACKQRAYRARVTVT